MTVRDLLYRTAFFAIGGLATGVSQDVWTTLATIATILVGWFWLESRFRSIVKQEIAIHAAQEREWIVEKMSEEIRHGT